MILVRKPAVADSFYPADTNQLNLQLSNFLQQATAVPITGELKILIVPHAGIVYSGKTAAWGFKQIENQLYKTVILFGTSHTVWFNHAAVFNQGIWETPLGSINIDKKLALQIINHQQKIIADLSPHWQEHDLEVELIFLQKVLSNFKILPILISDPDNNLVDGLAKKISEILTKKTLLVISSDLSHYPDYQTAQKVDSQTIDAIVSGKKAVFENKIKQLGAKNYPGVETLACGYQAIRVGLKIGEILRLKWKKIFYENSGKVSMDKSRVVGYGTIAGYK